MKCKICSGNTEIAFSTTIRKQHAVSLFRCVKCGFVQTQDAFWLKEAYENSINLSDTGLVIRNQRSARIALSIIALFFNKESRYLDFAGGVGLFTRIMRDFGIDFYWNDPYTANVLARGFEAQNGICYELATTFESYEHFTNPIDETQELLKSAKNILITTELIPYPTPHPNSWWYYGFDHGQHVAFYTKESFQKIAETFNLNYYNADNFQLLTSKPLPWWGQVLFKTKIAKQILYALSFPISNTISSKTISDFEKLKSPS